MNGSDRTDPRPTVVQTEQTEDLGQTEQTPKPTLGQTEQTEDLGQTEQTPRPTLGQTEQTEDLGQTEQTEDLGQTEQTWATLGFDQAKLFVWMLIRDKFIDVTSPKRFKKLKKKQKTRSWPHQTDQRLGMGQTKHTQERVWARSNRPIIEYGPARRDLIQVWVRWSSVTTILSRFMSSIAPGHPVHDQGPSVPYLSWVAHLILWASFKY